jgi:hypothetical protein
MQCFQALLAFMFDKKSHAQRMLDHLTSVLEDRAESAPPRVISGVFRSDKNAPFAGCFAHGSMGNGVA